MRLRRLGLILRIVIVDAERTRIQLPKGNTASVIFLPDQPCCLSVVNVCTELQYTMSSHVRKPQEVVFVCSQLSEGRCNYNGQKTFYIHSGLLVLDCKVESTTSMDDVVRRSTATHSVDAG